jgi:carboxypeptidase PM20D1
MKAILVGVMEAVEHQIARGHQPRRTIMLGFGHDEETGGQNGAAQIVRVLKQRGVRLEWVLDEGSAVVTGVFPGLKSPLALIGVAEKGHVTVDIVARAPGGHTSMPPYETAVTLLARAITTLQENPFSGGIEGIAAEMFRAIGPQLPFYYRAAIANQWLFAPMLNRSFSASPQLNAILRTTMAPTMLTGSSKDNVLPVEARAAVNIRIHPRDTVDSVLEHVRQLLPGGVCDSRARHVSGPVVCVEAPASYGFGDNPSPISSVESEGYVLIEKTVREVFQDAIVSPYLVIAATDARHFAEIAGDIYRFGPLFLGSEDLELPHGTDERISVEGLANLVRFYIRLIENLNG